MALTALAALPAAAQLEQKFDRFKNQTNLYAPATAGVMKEAESGRLIPQVLTNFPGEKPTAAPPSVGLFFRTYSRNGWRYLKCHGVDALVDGKPFPLVKAEPKHKGESIHGSMVYESVNVFIDWPQFTAITRASSVEFRVCTTEIKLTPKQLESWRALAKAASPP